MHKLLAAALLALGVSVAPSLALASGSGSVYRLGAGDGAIVSGTDLACLVGKSRGKPAVDCFRVGAKGVRGNSYSVGLGGVAVLQHVDAKGKISIVRKLQAGGRAAKTVKLAPGDGFQVAGSNLGCIASGGILSCFHFDPKGTVPNSYGIILSDGYAALVHYDAANKPKTVVQKVQP